MDNNRANIEEEVKIFDLFKYYLAIYLILIDS
jgi:hypothetical protein